MATFKSLACYCTEEHCKFARFNPKRQSIGGASDLTDLKEALTEYARMLAQDVRRIIEIDFEREAVV
jgi:hypothetical protein